MSGLSADSLVPSPATAPSPTIGELRVDVIRDERKLDSFAWNALAGAVPFRQHEWLSAWWDSSRRWWADVISDANVPTDE